MFTLGEDKQGMVSLPTSIDTTNGKLSLKHLSPQSKRKCFLDLAAYKYKKKKKKKND